jgi:putative ATP-dependent endonuclease of OLD family
MYLAHMHIENFRCFGCGDKSFDIDFQPGLTALVGENDSGKTAVIDAIRFVLGTTDQEWLRVEDNDFYETSENISIKCRFEGLSLEEKSTFIEYLTYGEAEEKITLTIVWEADKSAREIHGRPYHKVEWNTGDDGQGPSLDQNAKVLLCATYLRPLRDAEQVLSAGRGSRLAQILNNSEAIKNNGSSQFDLDSEDDLRAQIKNLNVLGISDLLNQLLKKQEAICSEKEGIDKNLKELELINESLKSTLGIGNEKASPDSKRLQLLEKLDLKLDAFGKSGLGSENLLFMACELILLGQAKEENKLLLIEEPEAHLHPQRQLQVMQRLLERSKNDGIQIIITTHSPNLASVIPLDNLVLIHDARAFPLNKDQTLLSGSDYSFLQRFLDVTKANLFFAKAVLIVEGDAENILIPALAHALEKDFTRHGVSIVNVGGVGLGRYARIFMRRDGMYPLNIPVACITDMDVMPDCAVEIIGLKDTANRRWKKESDFGSPEALEEEKQNKQKRANDQNVKTFVSNHWTFEYDLALAGLAEDVYICAYLAEYDDKVCELKTNKEREAIIDCATTEYAGIFDEYDTNEKRCSAIYAEFVNGQASKAIAAQYFVQRIDEKINNGELTPEILRSKLPAYILEAIDYVTASGKAHE